MRVLEGLSLADAAKKRVIDNVTREYASIPTKDGELDTEKFAEELSTRRPSAKGSMSRLWSVAGRFGT